MDVSGFYMAYKDTGKLMIATLYYYISCSGPVIPHHVFFKVSVILSSPCRGLNLQGPFPNPV